MARLSRLDEVYTPIEQYFVTACTAGRAPLLDNKAVHMAFRRFCESGISLGILVGRYVLMPDHLHLFVCFHESELGLSKWIKSLKNSLSKELRAQNISVPHWQKGFFDHLVRSDESYIDQVTYVRDNPVRAGLVERVGQWEFAGEIVSED